MKRPQFSCVALGNTLGGASVDQRYVVAYSGGLDSHALLHALAGWRDMQGVHVRAIHVNHNLHPQALDWQHHCESICRALSVELDVATIEAVAGAGESPEAAARARRYEAFRQRLQPHEVLLTAHTLDDQAETVLQRLLRGSGIRGLASIPRRRELGANQLQRPLLGFSRADLHAYASRHQLRWIDDPSNDDTRFTRNFMRHRVMPLLHSRFPAAAQTLARTAEHLFDDGLVLDELLRDDLARIAGESETILDVDALLHRSSPRRELLLRRWLTDQCDLPPQRARVQALLSTLAAPGDRMPGVVFGSRVVRRYRRRLYLEWREQPPLPPEIEWSTLRPLSIPGRAAPLRIEDFVALGLATPAPAVALVRFRAGGERIRLAGHAHRKALKKLLQEAGVPPWNRSRVPLLFVQGRLAAIADIGVADEFAARD